MAVAVVTAFAAAEVRSGYGVANSEVAFRGDAGSVVRAVVVAIVASLIPKEVEDLKS